ncbi:MAG: hypothetical protein JXB04_10325 [Kiritimatiellae bacterium]|nr:hypothetical protein [Kiritimatiellia bacterium]
MRATRPVVVFVYLAFSLAFLPRAVCARSDSYFTRTRSEANVFVEPVDSGIEKVAIMPFKGPTELIGSSVADLFVTEILRSGKYKLLERSQMAQVLGESELALAGLSTAQAVQLGSMAGADGVMIGTVVEYGTVAARGHAYPVVSVSVRLIDCQSGQVVWSADLAKRAESKSVTLPEHAGDAVHEIVSGLYQRWIKQRKAPPRARQKAPTAAVPAPVARRSASRSAPVEESAASPEILATPAAFTASDLGLREAVLKWGKPAPDHAKYEIQRSTSPHGTFQIIADVAPKDGEFRDIGSKDAPLKDDTPYYYRLVAVARDGRRSRPTEIVESMTAGAPEPPTALRVEAHDLRAARLTWGPPPSEGVERYIVERASAVQPETFVRVATAEGMSFSEGGTADSPLDDNTEYLYRVQAVNRVGAVGPPSEPVALRTLSAPKAVEGLAAKSGGLRCVPLSWHSSPAAEKVIRYDVYRRDTEKGTFTKVGSVDGAAGNSYLDGGADPGDLEDAHAYHYKVVAVNALGSQGADSAIVSASTRGAPPAVEGLVGKGGEPRRVSLSWKASPDEKADRYVIVRVGGDSREFKTIATVEGRQTVEYVDRGPTNESGAAVGLADGTEYAYSVGAVNLVGVRSKWATPVKVKTKPVPQTPAGLETTGDVAGAIRLSWVPNPEPDITSYIVEAADETEEVFLNLFVVEGEDRLRRPTVREEVPTPGKVRRYRVKAVDADGLESPWSPAVAGRSKPLPSPPVDLDAKYESGRILVTWTPPPQADVVSYSVWKQGRGGWEEVAEVREPAFAFDGSVVGSGLVAAVTAVDGDGLESERSRPLELGESAPNVPSGVAASSGGLREVVVTWTAPGDNAVSYRIERAAAAAGPFQEIANVGPEAGRYSDKGEAGAPLADSATYAYKVTALSANGRESEPGEIVQGTTAPPPEPPLEVVAEAPASRAISVSWQPSRSDGVVGYVIERAPAGRPSDFVRAGETGTTNFREGGTTASPLEDSTAYLYRVIAVNRVESASAPSEIARVTTRPPPSAVQGVQAESGQVRCVPVSWEVSPEDDIILYRVLRSRSAEGPFEEIDVVSGRDNTEYLDGGADPGGLEDEATYHYRVKAENVVNSVGAESEAARAVTRPPPPVVGQGVAESGRPREIPVSWGVSPDDKVIGYVVARADDPDGEFDEIATLDGRETVSFVDRGGSRKTKGLGVLADGTIYYYTVLAFNTARARSEWSEAFSARTKYAPAPPVGLTATTFLPKSVRVSWAQNSEPDIAEYVVEASARSGDRFRELARIPSDSAEGPTATEVRLDDGQKRYYRVKAIDADTLESDWSDEVEGGAKPLPHSPANLRVEFIGGRAWVSWDAPPEPDIDHYRVLRKAMLVWKELKTSPMATCDLGPEEVGKGLTVCVSAIDKDELESERSEPLEIKPAAP